jgi:post-segregation antitoxin (ccd killing protein)
MSKHKLTLSVDEEIIKEAKKLDINLSSFLEIRLREYIAIAKGIVKNNKSVDWAGFEPAASALRR